MYNMDMTGKMSLIDFGACREYRKDFVDDYLKLVWSAANQDDAEIMRVRLPKNNRAIVAILVE